MNKVVVCGHLDPDPARWLSQRARVVRIDSTDIQTLHGELSDAKGLIVRTDRSVDEALLTYAPQLKVVGRGGVGLDHIDVEACTKREIRVVYTPDANTQAVVEYVWTLILDTWRLRAPLTEPLPAELFHRLREQHTAARQLAECVLGVLGMGRIGRRVAQIAQSFGMQVIYNDLLPQEDLNLPVELNAEFVIQEKLWAESDILSLHIDGRKSNRYLLAKGVFDQLKPECILINTARGMIVEPNALARWARNNQSHGAMALLDVHDPEPPTDESPLWNLTNVKLFPHLGSRTSTAQTNMSWVVKDVIAVLKGEQPDHAAN